MNLINSIRSKIKSSLSIQFFLIILIVVFSLVSVSTWLLHNFVIARITETTEIHLLHTVEMIEDVLQHALMQNDMEMLQQMVFDIGVQRQADAIRLISMESMVLASTIPDEIGINLNRQDPRCQSCHTTNPSQLSIAQVQSFSNENRKIILVADQIENRIPCQGCHQDDGPYLGLILAEFPTNNLQDWQMLFKTVLVLGALLTLVLISGAIYIPLSARVIQPIKAILRSTRGQNLANGKNEIKQIANYITNLEEKIDEKEKNLIEQHRKIDTIFSLQFNIDTPPTLEKFFRQALGIIKNVTGYESITLRLRDPHTDNFHVMAQSGMTSRMLEDLQVLPSNKGFLREVSQTHLPAFTSDMPNEPRLASSAPVKEGFRSLACIPLLTLDKMVGSMEIAIKVEHSWSEEEIRWLALIGRRIGLLIHQIQLSEQLRDLAVLEERSRIAQEIHDGLAQLIGSLRLWAEEALLSLEKNDVEAAHKTLNRIENNARDAYAGLRDEMLGLRDTLFAYKDLQTVIKEYLNRFQRQWGIQTQLIIEETIQKNKSWGISPTAEIQLLRVLQEALTNTRRHSNATQIMISIEKSEEYLQIKIQDNGTGFNPEKIPEDRLGLRIMRERTADVGGQIAISSTLGVGTELVISIPPNNFQTIHTGET